MGKGARTLGSAAAAALLLGLFIWPAPCPADDAEKGIYEAVALKERELHLIETADELNEMLEQRGYLYHDPEMEELINRIGRQVAPPTTDPYLQYRFYVFRNPHPNAFALANGQVYINTGMLALLENEAQLATLLAHEVNHAAGHHGILGYRGTRKKLITATIVSSIGGIALGDLAYILTSYVVVRSILGYSRTLEEEADRRGIQMTLEAGYDVRESARMFEIMNRDPEGEHLTVKTKWSTHPLLLDRAAYLTEMAQQMGEETDLDSLILGAESYRELARPIALMTVEDFIDDDYPRSAIALAEELVAESERNAHAHYALGAAYRHLGARAVTPEGSALTKKQKKKRIMTRVSLTREEQEEQRLRSAEGLEARDENLDRAGEHLRRALELNGDLPEARRDLGMTLMEQGHYREAGKELLSYLKARPDALDKQIVLQKIKSVSEAIRAEMEGGKNEQQMDE